MSDAVLAVGKFAFLALLYIFFARVLRAVWVELNPNPRQLRRQRQQSIAPPIQKPGPAPVATNVPPRARNTPNVLRVTKAVDGAGRSYELLDGEITVGRAPGCAIHLDDSYASQLHARVFVADGDRYVEDLGSTNGTFINEQRISAPRVVQSGDRLRIGNTVLEFGR